MRIAQVEGNTPAFLRGADGLGGFPGARVAQSAPLHEPERRQAPPFGGMGGGRAFQIGPAHEGGGTGRCNPPDVEVFRGNIGHSGTIVSLWRFCTSYRIKVTSEKNLTRVSESRTRPSIILTL